MEDFIRTLELSYNNNIVETPLTKKCSKELEEYFFGKRKEFNIKLDVIGTEFQKE